ncbi:hypothetical protein [Bradyrhizobium sp. OAE829]
MAAVRDGVNQRDIRKDHAEFIAALCFCLRMIFWENRSRRQALPVRIMR